MMEGTKKKFVIKPFKVQPKVPENYETKTWAMLQDAVIAVDRRERVATNKEELYQAVEDLCLHKSGPGTYAKLQALCGTLVEARVEGLRTQGQGLDHWGFLVAVERTWQQHCDAMNTVRNIFLFLDRSYALQTPGVLPLWDMGLQHLKAALGRRKEVQDRVLLALLSAVEIDRQVNAPQLTLSAADAGTGAGAGAGAGGEMDLESQPLSAAAADSVGGEASQLLDYDVLKAVCRMLQSLRLYDTVFEPALLADSQRFYAAESAGLVDALPPAAFLQHVEQRLAHVGSMVGRYLGQDSSRQALMGVIEGTLLADGNTRQLICKGLPSLLDGHQVADVTRLYSMIVRLNRPDMLDLLRTQWTQYIRQSGEGILAAGSAQAVAAAAPMERATSTSSNSGVPGVGPSASKDPIADIVSLQDRLSEVLKTAFRNQETFRSAFRSSFEHFINSSALGGTTSSSSGGGGGSSSSSKVSELLSKHLDKKLRGEKGLSDSELEAYLDKCMALFFYISGKDMFEAFYRKYLSRRLLLGKCANTDLERSIIAKLKAECGSNYTSKLEGMFTDMDLSKDIMHQFVLHRNKERGEGQAATLVPTSAALANSVVVSGVDTNIQVLTTGFWPTPAVHFTCPPEAFVTCFPPEIRAAQETFAQFYKEKYQGRRLMWAYSLDRCVVSARFPKGRKDLEVSFHQALVLHCFNGDGNERKSLQELQNLIPLEGSELRRTLVSLCNGPIGTRVITKEPKGKDINDGDSFKFNAEFTNKLYHIKINSIQLREVVDDTEKVNEEVVRDRQYNTDAAVVRIMKARKRLAHNQLIAELMTQLKFPAKTADLKKRIESLIERDYLERAADDPGVYNYLA